MYLLLILQSFITKIEEKLNVINFCKKFLEEIFEKYSSNTQSSVRKRGKSVNEDTFQLIEK